MQKKKILAGVLAAAMAMTTLAGCGAGAAGDSSVAAGTAETTAAQTTAQTSGLISENFANVDTNGTKITFWHSMGGVNGEAMTYLVDKFNAENEYGITVEAVYQGSYDDAINKLKSAQIGNMGADLVQIYDIGTRFMIDSGWVIPMQEMIDASGYDISQIEPNIAAYYTTGDGLYSMPFNSSTPLLYYNKDMFEAAGIEQVPTSFSEIAEAGEKLKEAGCTEPIAISVYGWWFEQFMGKQGLDLVDNGNGRDQCGVRFQRRRAEHPERLEAAVRCGRCSQRGPFRQRHCHHRLHLRQGCHDVRQHRFSDAGSAGQRRFL